MEGMSVREINFVRNSAFRKRTERHVLRLIRKISDDQDEVYEFNVPSLLILTQASHDNIFYFLMCLFGELDHSKYLI